MSEVSNDPTPPTGGQGSINQRALPPDTQWRIAAIGAGAVVLIIAGVWFGGKLFGQHEPPPAVAASPPGTFRATSQQLKTLTIAAVSVHDFVGEELTEGKIAIDADRATPVYSPYSGRVIRIIAGPGDRVQQGAPLARVEASEFVQGQGDLRSAASQLKIAHINEARKHALFEAKGGSLQEWQQAQADLTAAETALDSVRNRLRILGKSEEEIAVSEAAKSMSPVATLAAPISGIVVDRQVGPGQYLQSGGGNPLFTIADPSSVWLLANVREADSSLVRLGQAVEVHVLAYPKRVFKARITYIAAVVDAVSHRLSVRAEIDNHDGALKPEMFASFRILTGDAAQSPAVPESAVVYEGETAHVWVVSGDDLVSFRAIRPGRTNDGLVEVLDGLKPGERIVTKGGLFIDQMAVPAAS